MKRLTERHLGMLNGSGQERSAPLQVGQTALYVTAAALIEHAARIQQRLDVGEP